MLYPPRKIIHIDMDAFFASVEQRDFPNYRNKPVVVGGSPDRRGVVAACSYEAREFGIHSAMPSSRAYRLCPQIIFVAPRFEVYRQVSRRIHEIFREYTQQIEPLSLDEAYLDVSDTPGFEGSATLIARDIKCKIKDLTGLTASAGVSYNKFLAKIASDRDKPDGLYVITPDKGPAFVEQLLIGAFYGVGRATEAKMQALGIHTGEDLKHWSLSSLQQAFGKAGAYYYHMARGIDERPVVSQRVRKSLGSETTFERDLDDWQSLLAHLKRLAIDVANDLNEKKLAGRTLTIKVKYDNFEQITRSRTRNLPLRGLEDMLPLLAELLAKTDAGKRKVRLLGVTISTLEERSQGERQMQLWFS